MLLSRVTRKLKKRSANRKDLQDVTNRIVSTPPPAKEEAHPETYQYYVSPRNETASPQATPNTSLDDARDELERVLKEAHKNLQHARSEVTVAQSEFERIAQEESQARDIYEHADPSMEPFVRGSLKKYWRLCQKRKKAAFRTLQASHGAVEDAQDVFEWTLKGALDKVERAKAQNHSKSTRQVQHIPEDDSSVNTTTDEDASPDYMSKYADERPSKFFGMFDAKQCLEQMEMEASEVESGDELSFDEA